MIIIDTRETLRVARWLDGVEKQIPFALSRTLNAALADTRSYLADDLWPQSVTVRNKGFAKFALRPKFSTKANLAVELSDQHMGNRIGILSTLSHGGVRTGRKGDKAIPMREIEKRRSGRGIPKSLRPRALPNSFRRGDAIFQRVGKGKRLRLRYILKHAVRAPKKAPLESEFNAMMRRRVQHHFPIMLQGAMRTARR